MQRRQILKIESQRLLNLINNNLTLNLLKTRVDAQTGFKPGTFMLPCLHASPLYTPDKCFTYVTKTIANSTTYSRKPGDYNGTIIFEFDIMKNSSPLNLKFTFFATVKTKITLLFCWTHSTLSSASKCDRVNQNKRNNQKICEKVKYDQDLN